MSKNLEVIQVFAKIGRVFSIVVFVCSIIGAAGCALAAGLFGLFLAIGLPLDMEFFTTNDAFDLFRQCFVTCFACIGSIVLSYMAKNYFKYQCDAGTPFTFEGANKILRLGIVQIIVMIAVSIFAAITDMVYWFFATPDPMEEILYEEPFYDNDITLGLIFIFLSFLFKYGAEQLEIKKAAEATHAAEPTPVAEPTVNETHDAGEFSETSDNSTSAE